MALTMHPSGNYSFLPGIAPYSCGVIAAAGHEIVYVTLRHPLPWRAGFDQIALFLDRQQRPRAALCSVSLRSPVPFSFEGFAEFNAGYAAVLQDWGVFVNGVNPVARTNVAPVIGGPSEPSLYGFGWSRPASENLRPTFVVAGAGELPEGVLQADAIVARGDTSEAGLTTKARFVMQLMQQRLTGLGVAWADVTTTSLYTQHSVMPFLADDILRRMDGSSIHGVHWHFSQPPIREIEFEMDVRGTRTELHWS